MDTRMVANAGKTLNLGKICRHRLPGCCLAESAGASLGWFGYGRLRASAAVEGKPSQWRRNFPSGGVWSQVGKVRPGELFGSQNDLPQMEGHMVGSTEEDSQSAAGRVFGIVFLRHSAVSL